MTQDIDLEKLRAAVKEVKADIESGSLCCLDYRNAATLVEIAEAYLASQRVTGDDAKEAAQRIQWAQHIHDEIQRITCEWDLEIGLEKQIGNFISNGNTWPYLHRILQEYSFLKGAALSAPPVTDEILSAHHEGIKVGHDMAKAYDTALLKEAYDALEYFKAIAIKYMPRGKTYTPYDELIDKLAARLGQNKEGEE